MAAEPARAAFEGLVSGDSTPAEPIRARNSTSRTTSTIRDYAAIAARSAACGARYSRISRAATRPARLAPIVLAEGP